MKRGTNGNATVSNRAHLFYGDWYTDKKGRLYIVSAAPDTPVFGPNDCTRLHIGRMYYCGEPETTEVENNLSLRYVPARRRYFNPKYGYSVSQ